MDTAPSLVKKQADRGVKTDSIQYNEFGVYYTKCLPETKGQNFSGVCRD